MVPLDNIRVSRRRALRLAATTLATLMLRRISRASGALPVLPTLLRCILVGDARLLARELSAAWLLLRNGAVVHAALLARGPRVRDNVVCGALAAALAVGYLAVAIVGIGVLEDGVPGVEQAGEEAEAAQGDVDEGVGRADSALYPHYGLSQYLRACGDYGVNCEHSCWCLEQPVTYLQWVGRGR
jgi:hypothetical protein